MSVSIQWKVIQQYYFYQVFWKIPQSPGYSLWPQGLIVHGELQSTLTT